LINGRLSDFRHEKIFRCSVFEHVNLSFLN